MKNAPAKKPFRVNPIEIVIFLLVACGFSLSLYNLFRENDEISFSQLPFSKPSRMPGSVIVTPNSTPSMKIEDVQK